MELKAKRLSIYQLQGVLRFLLYALVPCLSGVLLLYAFRSSQSNLIYYKDYEHGGAIVYRHNCSKGRFSIPYMDECVPWLRCRDIESNKVEIKDVIGAGAVKVVHRARWNGYEVVLNNLINPSYKKDFTHGLEMLIQLQPSQHVSQLIGYCRNKFVTQYYPLGSANNIEKILSRGEFEKYDTPEVRFELCINYVEVINFLHTSPIGTRVMCDSNDLHKTLSQFLVTSDFKLVVNDVDALPLVDHSKGVKIKCGKRQIFGDFVAPEQLWVHKTKEFTDEEFEPYDEKTDIYKIPAVCEHFLGNSPTSEMLKFHLFSLHKRCKSNIPEDRPSATDILQEYRKIWNEFRQS